jgi:peptidyl-prolyl cis-trans isomerase A (cyclophilin A)
MNAMKIRNVWCLLLILTAAWGCTPDNSSLTHDPAVPTAGAAPGGLGEEDVPKGETFYVLFKTSEGDFIVAVHPGWAPIGAEHFREMVEAKYYDNCRFFRVMDGFMAQVGINGDPAENVKWHDKTIQDDPVKVSNRRGRVTYAKTGQPNSRSTQVFFNYGDNVRLDADGFAPFAEVIKGMDVLEKLYKGYGDGPPYGAGPEQDKIRTEGNQYLNAEFPELDYIETARIYDTQEGAEAAMSKDEAATAAPATDAAASQPEVTEPSAAEPEKEAAPASDTPTTEAPAAETPAETPAADPAPAESPAVESPAPDAKPQ